MNRYLLAIALLLPTQAALADSISDQLNQIRAQLQGDLGKRTTFEAVKRANVEKLDGINMGIAAYKKGKADLIARKTQLNSDTEAVNAEADRHNAHQCQAPADNPGVCEWYNQEASQIQAKFADLTGRQQAIMTTYDALEKVRQSTSDDALAWAASEKTNNAAIRDNEAEIVKLTAALRAAYNSCRDSLRQDKPEKMHEICGAPFDGNRTDLPELGSER